MQNIVGRCKFFPFVHLSFRLSVHLPTHLSIYPFIFSSFHLFIHPFFHPFIFSFFHFFYPSIFYPFIFSYFQVFIRIYFSIQYLFLHLFTIDIFIYSSIYIFQVQSGHQAFPRFPYSLCHPSSSYPACPFGDRNSTESGS